MAFGTIHLHLLCQPSLPMFHDVKHEIDGFCRYGEGGNQYLFILIRYHDAVFLLQLRSYPEK